MSARSLAVVVVSYNSNDVLEDCIAALDAAVANAGSELSEPYDLVLVDNDSSVRPTVADVAGRRNRVVLLDENLGFSRGVNRGLQEVPSADLVLLLNPDARLRDDTLSRLIGELLTHHAVIAGPLLEDENGEPRGMSERPFHSIKREFVRQFVPWTIRDEPFSEQAARSGVARCLTGACLLVDGDFLRAQGGLDTAIAMYLEDVELCWQAHASGRPVRFARDARCGHALGGSSGGENFDRSIDLHLTLMAARVEFIRRRSGAAAAVITRGLISIGSAARVMAARALRDRRLVVKHRATLRWALTSGRPPAWPPGSVSN